MGNTIYPHSDKNSDIAKMKKELQQGIGSDALVEEDEYNLDVFGEFVPSFDAWITPENQKERMKEIIKGME